MLLQHWHEGVLWLELRNAQVRTWEKLSRRDILLVLCTLCWGRGGGGALGCLWLLRASG